MEKWYKGVYRRHLTDMHIPDFDDAFLSRFSAEEYYENLVRAKIQAPMIYLHSHVGLSNYRSDSGRGHKRFLKGENEIKKLIRLCKNGGMKVVGYYSLIFNNLAVEMHPEWEMRYQNGDTWRDRGQRYGLCCPNNKEYRKFLMTQIDELSCEFADLDGIFFDMPYWELVCHCDSCKIAYLRDTGMPLPEKEDFNSPEFLRFVKARQDFMVDFVKFVREYTEVKMPNVTVEFNYAAVIGCDWLGGSTEGINNECEFTGGDLYGDLYSHSFACKYYYGVTNNQPFEYMTCRCDSTLREHTITKSLPSLESQILLTAAHHGASLIIDAIDPVGTLDSRVYDRVGEAFSRQLPFEPYMDKGELYAEVAVYFDSKTMFSGRGDDRYNRTSAIGAVRKLAEAHIPTAVISNMNMHNLFRYHMIIAPSLQDFDNDEPLTLIEYVKNGGVLYLSGRSDSRLMREFFSAEIVGETYMPEAYDHRLQLGARTYIAPTDEGSLGEFTAEYPLPLAYNLPILSEGACGEIKAKIMLPYADPDDNFTFSSIHSCPPWQLTGHPAIIERKYGLGKVVWVACELEYDNREAFSEIFIDFVLPNIKGKYECKTSKSVEMIVFEGENTLISFVDLLADKFKTISPFEVSIKMESSPVYVRNIESGELLPFDFVDGALSFVVNMKDFAMYEIGISEWDYITDTAKDILTEYRDAFLELAK